MIAFRSGPGLARLRHILLDQRFEPDDQVLDAGGTLVQPARRGPVVLYWGDAVCTPESVDSALAKTGSLPTLGIFRHEDAVWASDRPYQFTDALAWPGHEAEVAYRLNRLCPAGDAPPAAADSSSLIDEFLRLNLVGESAPFLRMLRLVRRVARFDVPVLILGDTGTGKELVARAVHYLGPRRDQPFVPVNCGAIPDGLAENELFGHARGAYTDAREAVPGLVAQADRGTLFLDEIETLSAKGQTALLRFIEDHHYRPIGSRRSMRSDVRILAASNQDLGGLVAGGRFRRDLLYRLDVLSIRIPPLRERGDDLAVLAEHFIDRYRDRYEQRATQLAPGTLRWMRRYHWPGNVRELENLIQRWCVLCEGPLLSIDEIGAAGGPTDPGPPAGAGLTGQKASLARDFEREYLCRLMAETGGNVTRAAARAGRDRSALGKLLKKHGIDRRRYARPRR